MGHACRTDMSIIPECRRWRCRQPVLYHYAPLVGHYDTAVSLISAEHAFTGPGRNPFS